MHDEDAVDRIVASWRREVQGVDFAALEIFSRIKRLAKRMDRIRTEVFRESGLEVWEFDVLSTLRRAGGDHTLSPKALIEATLVSSGTMTNRIDRLVARSLVRRKADPADGRGVLVQMAPEGAALVDAAIAKLTATEASFLESLDEADRQATANTLRAILHQIDD